MLERLDDELNKWLKKLEVFLVELRGKTAIATFFDKKAEKIINEYWDLLQLIYDEDVLPEMKKQGYDPEKLDYIPVKVWSNIEPKLKGILKVLTQDASDLLQMYKDDLKKLDPNIRQDLFLIKTTNTQDIW